MTDTVDYSFIALFLEENFDLFAQWCGSEDSAWQHIDGIREMAGMGPSPKE